MRKESRKMEKQTKEYTMEEMLEIAQGLLEEVKNLLGEKALKEGGE